MPAGVFWLGVRGYVYCFLLMLIAAVNTDGGARME